MSSLNPYLAKLESCLGGLPPNARQAVMEELRDHLEDRAAALQAGGLEEEASMSEAVERFGQAREVGAALRDVHGRGSWAEALAGMIPFLVIGLADVLYEYLTYHGHGWSMTRWLFVASYFALWIGSGVGWVKGFPRWSYPYAGWMLFTHLLGGRMTSGLWIFRGLGELIPLLVLAAVVLLLTRSLRPLLQFFKGLWHDWTRLSFGLYGMIPVLVTASFDEVTKPYAIPYLVASTVVLAGGALAYVRSSRTTQRALALLTGMTLAWTVTTVGYAIYGWTAMPWRTGPGPWYVEVQGMVAYWGGLLAFFLAPALLNLLRRSAQSIRAA
ncbi:MAG: permease prefix domain 1-containing protein [Chloroflexota bacterium]|nr:permease prefix domain 1-containing protein [Chloroflexota bacterium]